METIQEEKTYKIKTFTLKYIAKTPPPSGEIMSSPERVVNMAKGVFAELDGGITVEHFAVAFVNTQNNLIAFKAFNTGTIDQVAVYPRLIIHSALMLGAGGMVLVHNHPSGYAEPSDEDKRLTRCLKDAARLFDIRLLDHIIVTQNNQFSFLDHGLI
jgi:DNA repair protein RadC